MDDRSPVSEVMNRTVVKTRENASLAAAARLMREAHVSGLPVVGTDGKVVGVLSEVDLVRGLHRAAGVASPRGLLDLVLESRPLRGPSLLEVCQRRLENGRVRECMTGRPVTVDADATIHEAARRMKLSQVNRLPVLDESGHLAGIVTRQDVIDAISGAPPRHRRGALRPRPGRPRPVPSGEDLFTDI